MAYDWECISDRDSGKHFSFSVYRKKVPGGWLVTVDGHGVTFYPDPEHKWDGQPMR